MLNEPAQDEVPAGGAGAPGEPDLSSFMGSASITPADKEAIERVSHCLSLIHCLYQLVR